MLPRANAILVATLLTAGCFSGTPAADRDAGGDQNADAATNLDAGPTTDAEPPPDAPPLGDGVLTLSGSAEPGTSDGARNVARFSNPVNVAIGPDDQLYVADFDNGLIRRVTPLGIVSTLIDKASFQRPFGLAFASDGTLYVETDNNDAGAHSPTTGTIWKVDTTAGTATVVVRDVGRPRGLAVLGSGDVVLSDMNQHTVRLLDPGTGNLTVLAGATDQPGFVDGVGTVARFNEPYDVVVTQAGDLLVADFGNHCIRKVAPDGTTSTFAGSCGQMGYVDGASASARFNNPQGLALDDAGNLFVTDTGNYRIREIATDGTVSTVAGDGTAGFRDGDPSTAQFYGMEGQDVTADGAYLYVADGNRGDGSQHNRLRRLTTTAP